MDLEQQNGVFNSPGARATSIGFSIPLELAGQRGWRIDLARAELEASEADIADRERRIASDVRLAYIETLAAQRELEVTQSPYSPDVETARVVAARVEEGDAAPLESNLLRAEVDRLQARRDLVEGRLRASATRLKQLVGMAPDEQLQLREALVAPLPPDPPASLDAAVSLALRARPDLRFARLSEDVARAGYRPVKAQSAPQVTVGAKFTNNLSAFDDTPVGVLRDRDRLFAFGVSISHRTGSSHIGGNDLIHRRPDKQVKQSELNRPREKKLRRPAVFTLVAGLFWLSLILVASGGRMETVHTSSAAQKEPAQSAPATPTPQSPEREVKDTAWDPAWPPLPGKGKPAKPIKEVRAMYAFAARHPEVLQYAPCYCGCERLGHKSVLDCFIKGRDANGGPQWDAMGFT